MNIRDVHTGTYRPDQLRNGSVGEAGRIDAGTAARNATEGPSTDPRDRVELSTNVHSALNGATLQELAFAKRALQSIPPLDDGRGVDILRRIQEGHYSQPEILMKIAERFTEELSGAR